MDKVFLIHPYEEPFTTIRDTVLVPAIKQCGMQPVVAETAPYAGPVAPQIIEFIESAKACVADLTGNNPNVVYEVAVAHSKGIPVILITQGTPEGIPFDIRHHRVIEYANTPEGLTKLSAWLTAALEATGKRRELPVGLLRQMLVPRSLGAQSGPYIVAATPFSWQASGRGGGWKDRTAGTYGDHLGIRGLMQAFGLIFGLDRLPELMDPDDFEEGALEKGEANIYTIASPKANQLTGVMMKKFFAQREPRWRFAADPEAEDLRRPKPILMMEGRPYQPARRVPGDRLIYDFGLLIRGPRPSYPDYMFMAMAGRSARGTEATCLAATDPDCLQILSESLRAEGVDLEDHKQAFCAVVSVCACRGDKGEREQSLGPDKESFRVEDVSIYE